jgi:hypothetical protein
MDGLLVVVGKIGGFAAIGGLIDLALRRSEKQALTNWLIVWWDRFDSVKWSNFGRQEAEWVVQLLDRHAGARLWSWKRWYLVLAVAGPAYVLMLGWTLLRFWLGEPNAAPAAPPELFNPFLVVIRIAVVAMLFGFSLSATRLVSRIAASWSTGTVATICTFAGLLVAHLALLVFWDPILFFLVGIAQALTMQCLPKPASCHQVGSEILSMMADTYRYFASHNDLGSYASGLFEPLSWNVSTIKGVPPWPLAVLEASYASVMNLIANGLRIAMALAFLSSFVFRPLIQSPISRLWAGVIDSEKPIFTTLFAVIGVVIALFT